VFQHCIHCSQRLGANQVVEHFQVGRKLAFDSERGRLWVICPHCARWNLTPLEERWEAVEACERMFGKQRLRAQTTHIGYVEVPGGLGLVRIGRPLRPEFAAWRYGREFTRRRTRAVATVGVVGFAAAGLALGSVYVGSGILLPHLAALAFNMTRSLVGAPAQFELPRGPGREWKVSGDGTMILPDPEFGWRLSLRHHFGRVEHYGPDARRLLATLLTRLNRSGGHDALVRAAVATVEERPGEALFRHIAESSETIWSIDGAKQREFDRDPSQAETKRPVNRAGLSRISHMQRLALEMALNEDTEQRALEGELAELEAAWREAEEIAGIADNLFAVPGAQEFIDRNR
jgi:hypothetical protein